MIERTESDHEPREGEHLYEGDAQTSDSKQNEHTHSATRDVRRRTRRGAVMQTAEFGLAAKGFRAIDLSCRACGSCGAGAGCWAWIPGRGTFGVEPPTSD